MALKAEISKVEHDALPDAVKAEYEAVEGQDGTFRLAVEEVNGYTLTSETANLQAVQQISGELQTLRSVLPEDATADTIKASLEELAALQQSDPERQAELSNLKDTVRDLTHQNLLIGALVKNGFHPDAALHLTNRLGQDASGNTVVLDELGKPATKLVGSTTVPQTIDDLIASVKTDKNHIVNRLTLAPVETQGGDAGDAGHGTPHHATDTGLDNDKVRAEIAAMMA